MKLFLQTALYIFLPLAIVMAAAGAWFQRYGQRDARLLAQRQLDATAELASRLVERRVDEIDRALQSILLQESLYQYHMYMQVELFDEAEVNRAKIESALQRLVKSDPHIEAVELYRPNGERFVAVLDGVRSLERKDASGKWWFPHAFDGQGSAWLTANRRLRLVRQNTDEYGEPMAAALLIYHFEDVLVEAAEFATRHLDQADVSIHRRGGGSVFRHGNLPPEVETLQSASPLGLVDAEVNVSQAKRAAMAAFRAAEWTLFTAIGVVTLGVLAISCAGTQFVVKDLQAARRKADEANYAKSKFLANMSHEIRTPMNGVIGMTEVLSHTELNDEQRESLSMIRLSANSLLRILNDILDLSKIEANRLELESVPFRLQDCLDKTRCTLAMRAADDGLKMEFCMAPELPETLIGDEGRLRQILVNLIGNAIKFTEDGEIVTSVERDSLSWSEKPHGKGPDPSSGATARLKFSVRDTGVGIPADKQQAIFDAFTQADASTTRRYGGTGLGLAISSQLVRLMNGRIWLESDLGQGSTFHFTAEFGMVDTLEGGALDADVEPIRAMEEPRRRILLVEDSLVNQRVALGILKRDGHEVVVANNGREAVALWENDRFDLVLMDVQMPVMDGLEATARIRRLEQQAHRHTPILALTASAMKGDRDRCLEAGMDGYLSKPIVAEELRRAIRAFVQKIDPEPDGLLPEPAPSPHEDRVDAGSDRFDMEAVEQKIGAEPEVVIELAKLLLEEGPELMEQIEETRKAGDLEGLHRAAHTLKGSADIFDARETVAAAFRVECLAKNRELDAIDEAIDELKGRVGGLVEQLERAVGNGAAK